MPNDDGMRTEDDLECEFRVSPRQGIEFLHRHFRDKIYAYLASRNPGLKRNDLDDLYQDTIRRLIRTVRKPDFDPTRPMRLVLHIAKLASIDASRKKQMTPMGSAEDVASIVATRIRGTKVGKAWERVSPSDMELARRAIDREIRNLPPKQRAAANAMTRVFEEVHNSGNWDALRIEIYNMTQDQVTAEQARDNWRAARSKIAAALRRMGLDLLGEE